MEFINKYFELDKLGSNPKREFIAGLTTFFAMCYILFVNPSVLGASGMDKGAVFTATALASALGCLIKVFLPTTRSLLPRLWVLTPSSLTLSASA